MGKITGFIDFNRKLPGKLDVSERIKYFKEFQNANIWNEKLDLESLPDGVYILCLKDKNDAKLFKRIQKMSK